MWPTGIHARTESSTGVRAHVSIMFVLSMYMSSISTHMLTPGTVVGDTTYADY